MGDRRYLRPLEIVLAARDRAEAIRQLSDEEVVQALAAVTQSEARDAYLANVLATEAMNRVHRSGTITRTAAEALVSLDQGGRITHANPATCAILQAGAQELVGSFYRDHLYLVEEGHPLPPERCPIRHTLATGEALLSQEVRLQRKGGEIFPALVSVAAIERGGVREGAVLAFTDITERKKAEEEVRRERGRLYAILDNLTEGVLLMDAQGRYEFINRAAERILGHPRAQLVGARLAQRPYRLFQLDGAPVPPEASPISRALRTRQPIPGFRCLVERPDGARLPIEADVMPILERGELVGAVASFDDITQRLRAQRRLEEELKRQESLFDLFPDPIFNLGLDGRIQRLNAATREAVGYEPGELVGTHFAPLIHPDDLPAAAAAHEAVRRGERRRTPLRIRHKDGRHLPFVVVGVPLIVEGQIVGTYGIAKPSPDASCAPGASARAGREEERP